MMPPRPEIPPLDNLTLSCKEGMRALAGAPKRQPPEQLTLKQKADLGEAALLEYEQGRSIWHANLGPIGTSQLKALHEDLWDILASNQQDGDKAKGAVAVDAFPGLGKTTAVLDFALKHHRQVVQREGTFTAAGHERWPVCRVGLTSNIGMKEFSRSLLEYYAHPGRKSGTAALFAQRALDCVLECETRILVTTCTSSSGMTATGPRSATTSSTSRTSSPSRSPSSVCRAGGPRPVLRGQLPRQHHPRPDRAPHHTADHGAVRRHQRQAPP
jgi:hypothetical protein